MNFEKEENQKFDELHPDRVKNVLTKIELLPTTSKYFERPMVPIRLYLIIPALYITQFFLSGLVNNVSTLKNFWNSDGFKKSQWLEQSASANFAFMSIFSFLSVITIKKIGPGYTFSTGCLLSSVSLAVISSYINSIILFVFYGVVLGMGISFILFSTFAILKDCFPQHLSTVNGIVASGSCIGTMIQSVFLYQLCLNYSWTMILSCFAVVSCLLSGFGFFFQYAHRKHSIVARYQRIEKEQRKITIPTNIYIRLIVFSMAGFFFSLGYLSFYLYAQSYASSIALSENESRFVIAYLFLGSLFGRLTFGFVVDVLNLKRRMVLMFIYLFMGLSNIFSTYCTNYISFVGYSIFLGLLDGGFIALFFPAVCELFDFSLKEQDDSDTWCSLKNDFTNNSLALCSLVQGVGMIVGPIITTLFLKYGLSYDVVFIFSGSVFIIASILTAMLRFIN